MGSTFVLQNQIRYFYKPVYKMKSRQRVCLLVQIFFYLENIQQSCKCHILIENIFPDCYILHIYNVICLGLICTIGLKQIRAHSVLQTADVTMLTGIYICFVLCFFTVAYYISDTYCLICLILYFLFNEKFSVFLIYVF